VTEQPVAEEPKAVILDVGHGSAAVLIDGTEAIVVDAGSGDLVTETLERYEITEIASLIVSHRHHDHTSELPSLLSNPDLVIKQLFLNADPTRTPSTPFEEQLRAALHDSVRRNGTEFQQANVTLGARMSTARLSVDVLSPSVDLQLSGVDGETVTGEVLHPHALAVALRIGVADGRTVLLGADLDYLRFQELIDDEGHNLSADVFVYPHHGGRAGVGSEPGEEEFAGRLASAVSPEVVVFSNGRDRYSNPRREVVRGIRKATGASPVRLVCTQLSKVCSAHEVPGAGRLDDSLASAGEASGKSCCGSMLIDLGGHDRVLPVGDKHLAFVVDTVGEQALCLGKAGLEDASPDEVAASQ
jgi:beta-lactamase superfamily II metal-dependent hydrolase